MTAWQFLAPISCLLPPFRRHCSTSSCQCSKLLVALTWVGSCLRIGQGEAGAHQNYLLECKIVIDIICLALCCLCHVGELMSMQKIMPVVAEHESPYGLHCVQALRRSAVSRRNWPQRPFKLEIRDSEQEKQTRRCVGLGKAAN